MMVCLRFLLGSLVGHVLSVCGHPGYLLFYSIFQVIQFSSISGRLPVNYVMREHTY